jgi:CheY-like chemotaxis protein
MDTIFDAIREVVAPTPSGERYRVLVVDDNADLARIIGMLLRHSGFDVKLAHDGRLVLAVAKAFHPHYILLDIGLPGLDGCQVVEQLRSDHEFDETVIIAVTAYPPDMVAARCLKGAFDFHLTKPVSLEDLLALLIPRR